MSKIEKKQQRIYDLLNVKTKPVSLSTIYKAKKKIFTEKELLKEKGERKIEQKRKEDFLNALIQEIKKDSTTSIRKHANELKVHKKTEESN